MDATIKGAHLHAGKRQAGSQPQGSELTTPCIGALDLGTNNCRLLIARPHVGGLSMVDAFSRIVRLGEGLGNTGRLGQAAMDRTMEALRVCSNKLKWHRVAMMRLVATEACRSAANGAEFIDRVRNEIGLELEIIGRETEARLAAAGAEPLIDSDADTVVIFDIGGGSTELMLMERCDNGFHLNSWTSLEVGVVTLSERVGGGRVVSAETYDEMCRHVRELLEPFMKRESGWASNSNAASHLLGTSGTVTTIAGIHLGLRFYDRNKVDGCWLAHDDVDRVVNHLCRMTYEERVHNGCIGHERADLVLAGCAIFDEIRRAFPSPRIRVADRGLREGILSSLAAATRAAG